MEILYEDKFITVINKQEGLLSVPYPGSHEKTALDILCEIRRKRGMVHGSFRPAVVHRLDKPTSGVMMFALTPDMKKRIMDNWQSIVTSRLYRAVAENPYGKGARTLPDSGIIDLPLIQNERHHSYVFTEKYNNNQKGRFNRNQEVLNAVTHYKIIERGSKYTLFELELETGRTNQIRAHLSHLGYTLAGDKNYRAKTDPVRRLCLHARTLEFVHPVTKEKLCFEVPEPLNWKRLTEK